jgi:hypothetical protein
LRPSFSMITSSMPSKASSRWCSKSRSFTKSSLSSYMITSQHQLMILKSSWIVFTAIHLLLSPWISLNLRTYLIDSLSTTKTKLTKENGKIFLWPLLRLMRFTNTLTLLSLTWKINMLSMAWIQNLKPLSWTLPCSWTSFLNTMPKEAD